MATYTQQFRDFTMAFPADAQIGGKMVLIDLATGEPIYESELLTVEPEQTLTLNWMRRIRS